MQPIYDRLRTMGPGGELGRIFIDISEAYALEPTFVSPRSYRQNLLCYGKNVDTALHAQ